MSEKKKSSSDNVAVPYPGQANECFVCGEKGIGDALYHLSKAHNWWLDQDTSTGVVKTLFVNYMDAMNDLSRQRHEVEKLKKKLEKKK